MEKTPEKSNKFKFVLKVVLVLILISFVMAGIISFFIDDDFESLTGNVALIEIKGTIFGEKGRDLFFEDVTSSTEIRKLIRRADKNDNIKAIIFEINSPGGSAVASDEIADAIKKTNKTTVAWIREIGTSGAYWAASATDHIIANRMSITGSIGVIASYLQFGEFLSDRNISYERLVSGTFKDIGSPFKKLTPRERALFQKNLDKIHDYFVEEVANNRNMKKKDVEKLASGLFYLGIEAKELGLVDTLGGRDEVISYIEEELDIEVEIVRYKKDRSIFDVFASAFNQQSFYIGKGIASGFFTKSKLADSISIST